VFLLKIILSSNFYSLNNKTITTHHYAFNILTNPIGDTLV
jgi:hypothetical protein